MERDLLEAAFPLGGIRPGSWGSGLAGDLAEKEKIFRSQSSACGSLRLQKMEKPDRSRAWEKKLRVSLYRCRPIRPLECSRECAECDRRGKHYQCEQQVPLYGPAEEGQA